MVLCARPIFANILGTFPEIEAFAWISTFNEMSVSLAQQEDTIQSTMEKLNQLSILTLPLHSAHDKSIIFNYLRTSMKTLVTVEHIGIILPEEDSGQYSLHFFDTEIESIRTFNPMDQLSIKKIGALSIVPNINTKFEDSEKSNSGLISAKIFVILSSIFISIIFVETPHY